MHILFKQYSYSNLFFSNSILIQTFSRSNMIIHVFSVQTTFLSMPFLFKPHAFSVQTANLFMHFQFKQHSYLCIFCSNSILIHAFSVQTTFLFMHFQFKHHSYKFFTLFEQAHEILVIFAFSSNEGSDKPAQICRLFSAFTMRRSRGGGGGGGDGVWTPP